MRILLWHGYLLRGSGSNVYTANIARAWRAQGHDVLVLCQETDATALDFVDEMGAFDGSNSTFSTRSTGIEPSGGSCRVVAPDLDGLLPVYVYDDYEGFRVKTFVDLEADELERYTERNVRALSVALREFAPEAVVTGHEVMGPFIAREATAGGNYVAKLHGSALEYAVKRQKRYLGYAAEGLSGAKWVAGGSEYMVREAARVIPGWSQHAVVVNPGCDVDLFRPREKVVEEPPTVGFVGKFIAAKGVHHLIAAIPSVGVRDLRTVIVGYGGFERALRGLADGICRGDLSVARRIALEGERGEPLADLAAFLSQAERDPTYIERARNSHFSFPGRLEHGPLASVLPTFDVLAVPSVVPEAFGMVAAEAAACGVLPVVPDHSGIGEVGRTLESALGCEGLLVFDPEDPIRSMAERLEAVLLLSPDDRRALGLRASQLARERWSWTQVADRLRELASG